MTVASFEGQTPRIGAGTYIHPSADVFGDVTIGAGCWIGPGARIRGDYGVIVLGDHCSVEDNCVIHARPGEQTTIGNWVTVGHGAVIHNVEMIHDYAIIGMGAVVSDWARSNALCSPPAMDSWAPSRIMPPLAPTRLDTAAPGPRKSA
jgi:carbonic anhydrase/acetyltransferase-like protein (isoleucine patch superfamily)